MTSFYVFMNNYWLVVDSENEQKIQVIIFAIGIFHNQPKLMHKIQT